MEFKLIIKKLNKSLTQKEKITFSEWYDESKLHKNYFDKVQVNYQNNIHPIDAEKGWKAIERAVEKSKQKNNYWKYAIAASVVILISISFIFNKNDARITEPLIVNNTIEIGTDKATLTLEDGSNVILGKGKNYEAVNAKSNGQTLVYNTKNDSKPEIAYNYLTIPRGGQFFLQLSDGTKVWLNSESKIKYPKKFIEGKSRQVELVYGEAYFDVSPSTNHNGDTFKVNIQVQEIEVLGTEFNIKAYDDEDSIYTTLVEGKVAISNGITGEILKPNQQSAINTQNKDITMTIVDVYNETSWRNGVFSFNKKPLKEIMKTLSRWYDIDIVFINKDFEDVQFNGVLNKKQNIEHILLTIKAINNINYEINDNKILIK